MPVTSFHLYPLSMSSLGLGHLCTPLGYRILILAKFTIPCNHTGHTGSVTHDTRYLEVMTVGQSLMTHAKGVELHWIQFKSKISNLLKVHELI